jgi:aspartate dehydrogenase
MSDISDIARDAPAPHPAFRPTRELTVAVGGFGAIGRAVARSLDRGMTGLKLVAVSARNVDRARLVVSSFEHPVPVEPLERLAEVADIIIECVPAAAFPRIAIPALNAGRILIAISVGALIANQEILDLAAKSKGRIIVPSGALLGLDAVQAAAEGVIRSVRMVTRKPPRGLSGAPYLRANGIDIANITEPLKIFSGSAREAAAGFPENLNVAAALGLAGVGPDRTIIEVWADPWVERNEHTIMVACDSADFEMTISNIPSLDNPRTGKITALSVVAALRKLTNPIQIGT